MAINAPVLDYVLTLSDGTRMRVQALDAAEATTMADDVVSTVQVHPGTTAPVAPTGTLTCLTCQATTAVEGPWDTSVAYCDACVARGTHVAHLPTDVSAYFREANRGHDMATDNDDDVAEFEAYSVQRTYRVASGMRDVWQDRETDRLDAQDRAAHTRLTY